VELDHHIDYLHFDPSWPAFIDGLVKRLRVVPRPQLSTTAFEWLGPPSQRHVTSQASLDYTIRKAFALAHTTLLEALW
jgi:hypothetical protein